MTGRQDGQRSQVLLSQSTVRPHLVIQLSHANHISAMAVSPNGRLLVTASWDRTVRLWDATSGQELRRLQGHRDVVTAVAVSPDARFILTGSKDQTARLWDTSSGEQTLKLTGHTGAITAVAFAPHRALLLTGSDDTTMRLWDRNNGHELYRFGHTSRVASVAFAPDERHILSGSDTRAFLWDVKRGQERERFEGHEHGVTAVAMSPDGRFVLTGSLDTTARLWDLHGKEIYRFTGHTQQVTSVAFAPDGGSILTGSTDGTARLWKASSGEELRRFDHHPGVATLVAFAREGGIVFTASKTMAFAWDVTSGKQRLRFAGNSDTVSAVAFSPDGYRIAIGSWDDTAHAWDIVSGVPLRRLQGHGGNGLSTPCDQIQEVTDLQDHHRDVRSVTFSPDSRSVLTGSRDGTARLWDVTSGKEVHRFQGHTCGVRIAIFSPDGRFILTGSDDKTAQLWEAIPPFNPIHRFEPHADRVTSAAFSPDGRTVLTSSNNTVQLWDTTSGKEIRSFLLHTAWINAVAFSPDGNFILIGSEDTTARLWDVRTGTEQMQFKGHTQGVLAAVFSRDGHFVLTGGADTTARLWDIRTRKEIRRFEGHTDEIRAVAFSPNEQLLLTGSSDQTARLWNVATGEELARLISFSDDSWAVIDADGRFDAANGGAVEGLHWVIGTEAIALSQLKERYYDPGLLAKKAGGNPEPVRNVQAFTAPKLFPAVHIAPIDPEKPALHITLTDRGGGVGRVVITINGKEVEPDARYPDPQGAHMSLSLVHHSLLIPGQPNAIAVRAFNAEDYLSSRGETSTYQPPGEASSQPPTLWAIVAGISKYAGTLNLRFAAKDAHLFAQALRLGAERFLRGPEHVHVTLLTTSEGQETLPPTKKNFEQAFAQLQKATSSDILVIYLSGHGTTMGDDYYYLTQDARSNNDLGDPELRPIAAISSAEMVRWLKQSPALKQVMVVDTCDAGAVAKDLLEPREVASDQIRALERLKDRTGFHVLMGSAADAPSYELSPYEQGLLTYTLLMGMKGAALHEDGLVDVSRLFQYAADEVPRLAQENNGSQKPRIAAPKGTSFDIGQLSEADRQSIPLAAPKPLLLQPILLNARTLLDDLNLTVKIRKQLREASYASGPDKQGPLPAVYLDVDQFPGAIRPSGTYIIEGTTVIANLVLGRDTKDAKAVYLDPVRGSHIPDLDEMSNRIVDAIRKAIAKIN